MGVGTSGDEFEGHPYCLQQQYVYILTSFNRFHYPFPLSPTRRLSHAPEREGAEEVGRDMTRF